MKQIYQSLAATIAIAILTALTASADTLTDYYANANGKSGAELKNALTARISVHDQVSSYNNLPSYFRRTDAYEKNGIQYWWDMYSSIPVQTSWSFGSYMNREHSFPKSWWGGSTATPAYTDLFHLYPAEAAANMAKSNHPLGEVGSTTTFDNDFVKVGYPRTGQGGGAQQVFEPNDEYKGDFARTYFYMVTCYPDLTWTKKYMYMLEQNNYPTLNDWAVALLLKWHREDQVSQKELDRNDMVYTIQRNRNPFIDYPQLAEYIWGNRIGQKFDIGESPTTGIPTLESPINQSSLDFTQLAKGKTSTERLALIGSNLTGKLSMRLSGTNRTMFSIESTTIDSKLVNGEGGYMLPITYKPTETGVHTATLTLYDGGLTGSVNVKLMGECLEAPNLTAPVALPASDITESAYTANWEEPAQTVDYYIVTRTIYSNGTSSTEELLAETNSLRIEGFENSTSESYNVRSVAIGVESPISNEIFVEHSGITGVEVDAPLGWARWEGGLRIVCGEPQNDMTIYDMTGRIVRVIPTVMNNDIILLPHGAYLIVTADHHTPLRVLVD